MINLSVLTTRKLRRLALRVLLYLILTVGLVISSLPFYWTFISSFKQLSEIFAYPPNPFPTLLSLENYRALLDRVPFARAMFNSAFIATCYTGLSLFLASMVGFGFAKYKKAPGATFLFVFMLASLMVPFQTVAISLFVLMTKLHWVNSYQAVIVPFVANAFSGFLMTQYMEGVPGEILDAARIDGCTEWQIYYKIALPIMRPALAAVGVLAFMHSWNNFFWPLIVLSKSEMLTVPLVLAGFIAQQALVPYHLLVAGITLATLPLILAFWLAQKQFIAGLTMGALKG